jgi:hypothetical protein
MQHSKVVAAIQNKCSHKAARVNSYLMMKPIKMTLVFPLTEEQLIRRHKKRFAAFVLWPLLEFADW